MKRTEPLKISSIINELFKHQGMEETMLRHRVLQLWPEVVGPHINRLTVERRLSGSTLLLRIVSAPMRNELAMNKSMLLDALNRAAGKQVISDIRFI